MKESKSCDQMARNSPIISYPPIQEPLPTPSPFSFSVASTGALSSRPTFGVYNLFLRFFAVVFSFVAAISLASPSPHRKINEPSSFIDSHELVYCFIVDILVSFYSAYQLCKSICDIAYKGCFISDIISDYSTFILDQLVAYLLISSSSIYVFSIDRQFLNTSSSLRKAVIISTTMSYITFFIIATCTLLSGFKLCKRLIW